MVKQPRQHRIDAASAQRTTLLATADKLSPCTVRRDPLAKLVDPIDSVPPFGILTGVTRWSPIKTVINANHTNINDRRRDRCPLDSTARHCPCRGRNVKQLFFKKKIRGKQVLRTLKRLFRAANFSTGVCAAGDQRGYFLLISLRRSMKRTRKRHGVRKRGACGQIGK